MTGISTLGLFSRLQQSNLNTQARIQDLNEQISSGKKGNSFGDFGASDSRVSLDLRPTLDRYDIYTRNINLSRGRTDIMETVLTRVSEISRDMSDTLVSLQGTFQPSMGPIREKAAKGLQEVTELLNSIVDGRHVFAGAENQTAPISSQGVADLLTSFRTASYPAAFATPASLTADFTAVSLQRDTSLSAVSGAGLGAAPASSLFATAVIANTNDVALTLRIDDGMTRQIYGVPGYDALGVSDTSQEQDLRADAFHFREIIRGLAVVATMGDYPTNGTTAEQQGFKAVVAFAQTSLKSGKSRLDDQIGILGNTVKSIDDTRIRLDQTALHLKKVLGKAEDVDVADAISRLQLAQTQLQASYQVTAKLQELTLVNFL
jgi:flagellar hook-associated protein 3 FlgL